MSDDEERRLVEEALHCVRLASAGHWPTVAGILAAEVERLRAELARRDERITAVRALADEWVRSNEQDPWASIYMDEAAGVVFAALDGGAS